MISARAIATLWASPPESSSTLVAALPAIFSRSIVSSAFLRSCECFSPVGRAGTITFSRADSPRMRLNCWKMKPKVARRTSVRNRSGRLVSSLS